MNRTVCSPFVGSPNRVWVTVAATALLIAGYSLYRGLDGGRFSVHRPEFLAIARRLTEGTDPWIGTGQVRDLRQRLAQSGLKPVDVINLRIGLGLNLLRVGETDEAIETILSVFAMAEQQDLKPPEELNAWMALAYLRQAEVQNCIARNNGECCIFPLAGGGVHTVTGPAELAKQYYLNYLEATPGDLRGRWLLNLTAMALGEHPDGVPERHLIPSSAFASEYDIGRFVNVAPTLGVDTFNLCGGTAAEDFDNDGLIDIVTSTYDPAGALTYYRNLGNGGFEDLSAISHLDDQLGGLNLISGDYDNDGDMDLLVLRGAWLRDEGNIRNSLLRNEGDGTFTDVTHEAGLATPAYPTQTATWADIDNDGDLDLFIGNESRPQEGANFPSQLFRNNGNGKFTDIAVAAGVTNDRYCKGVAAGDFDNDGDVDLYVSNFGPNRLYSNNGNGTFTDTAAAAGVLNPAGQSFGVWFFDSDHDGWLDLFVAAYEAGVDDLAADYLGLPHDGVSPCLYRNNGDGTFTDVAVQMGIAHPYLPMGANFGDLDNDGYLDMYLTTGDPDYNTLTPNVMLRNDGGERFQDVTTSGGFGHLQKGHGVAFADFDHDGDQDMYNQLGGFYPGDKFHNAFYLNPGHGNHYLHLELVGTETNRSGVGARIMVVATTPSGSAAFHRAVGSTSSFGGSPLRQEIGLGVATGIERIEVWWPVSKTTQVFENVPLDAVIRVTEGADEFERVQPLRFSFPK